MPRANDTSPDANEQVAELIFCPSVNCVFNCFGQLPVSEPNARTGTCLCCIQGKGDYAGDEQISALQQQVARLTAERDAVLEDAEHRGAELFKQLDTLNRHLDAIAAALGLDKPKETDTCPKCGGLEGQHVDRACLKQPTSYLPDQLAGMVRELLEERNAERQRAEKNGAESRELAWQLAAARADGERLNARIVALEDDMNPHDVQRIDAKLQEVENRTLQARANADRES